MALGSILCDPVDLGSESLFCREILEILDPKVSFHRGMLWILDLDFCSEILGILYPEFLFSRGIPGILELA